jgi:DNA-binding response OmpR family regulator
MRRIMVVDEGPKTFMLYEEVLSGLGYEAYFAANAAEAWELFREHRPDLVIMDLDISDGLSLETLKKIRCLDPCVPILATSVKPTASKNPALTSIGVAAVLTKPIDIGILRLRLEQSLKTDRSKTLTTG